VRQFEFIDRYGVIDHGGRLSDGYAAHSRPTPTTRPTAPQAEEGPMAGDGKKIIRNAAAEFLIFTGQASPQCVEP